MQIFSDLRIFWFCICFCMQKSYRVHFLAKICVLSTVPLYHQLCLPSSLLFLFLFLSGSAQTYGCYQWFCHFCHWMDASVTLGAAPKSLAFTLFFLKIRSGHTVGGLTPNYCWVGKVESCCLLLWHPLLRNNYTQVELQYSFQDLRNLIMIAFF